MCRQTIINRILKNMVRGHALNSFGSEEWLVVGHCLNKVMNFQLPWTAFRFLTAWNIISLSRRTMFHGSAYLAGRSKMWVADCLMQVRPILCQPHLPECGSGNSHSGTAIAPGTDKFHTEDVTINRLQSAHPASEPNIPVLLQTYLSQTYLLHHFV